jgi:hypothetical protein
MLSGTPRSTVSSSLPNLDISVPEEVELKKERGALKTDWSIRLCKKWEALKPTLIRR